MKTTTEQAIETTGWQRITAELMANECELMCGHRHESDIDKFYDVAERAVGTIESIIDTLVNAGAIDMEDDSDGRLRDNLTRARAALDRAREWRDRAHGYNDAVRDRCLAELRGAPSCDCGRDKYEPHAHDCAIR